MSVRGMDGFDRVISKLEAVTADFTPDLQMAGETAAEAIVQTTLAGVGDADAAFVPYSAAYLKKIEQTGGKSTQNVNLRGIYYHANQTRKKYRSLAAKIRERAGRARARSIHSTDDLPVTQVTRPSLGLTDPRSEMSLDLIRVDASETGMDLTYTPRETPYMITHQNGDDKMPARRWFSLNKAAVKAGVVALMAKCLEARARFFNE